MSEEPQITPPEAETTHAGPEGTPSEPQVDWHKRFEDTQAAYTQGQQELSRQRQEAEQLRQERELYQQMLTADDPQARREAAEVLGYEIPDDEAAGQQQFVDDQARRDAQKAAQWIDSFEQQAQQYNSDQTAISHINEQFPSIEQKLGRELTQEEAQVIGDLAMANRDEHGTPMVDPAAELVLGVLKAAQDRRPKPRAPHFSGTGAEATQVPNLDNRQERQAHMAAQLMANEQ